MRRWLYWLGMVGALALLAGGAVIALRGYGKTSGPDGVVRAYFAALRRGDAADALAFGTVPPGPHTLLTAAVLREQQRIAPVRDLSVKAVRRTGDVAGVDVTYRLGFRSHPTDESATLHLHHTGAGWRLDRAAVPTELDSTTARDRQSIVGAGIPAGTTLLFPGALPIRLDTPYLQLDPQRDYVGFDPLTLTTVYIEVSPAGRTAALHAVRAKLGSCLAAPDDTSCPLPGDRYVPGSVHGRLKDDLGGLVVDVAADPPGTLLIYGEAVVSARYVRLNFRNGRVAGRGDIDVDVNATGYPMDPLVIRWVAS